MARDEAKGHAALRRGRVSVAGARYFLTLCTRDRQPGLTSDAGGRAVQREVLSMEGESIWRVMALTVMPDHVHVLMELDNRLTLSKAVSRLKAKTALDLRLAGAGLAWERGFFDHRLRPDDKVAAIVRYIAMNPVRAGLIAEGQAMDWAWLRLGQEESRWFEWGSVPDEEAVGRPDWLQQSEG